MGKLKAALKKAGSKVKSKVKETGSKVKAGVEKSNAKTKERREKVVSKAKEVGGKFKEEVAKGGVIKRATAEGPSMKSKIYMSGAERYDIKEASDQDLSSSARKHYSENAQHNMKTRGGSSLSKHFQGNKRR